MGSNEKNGLQMVIFSQQTSIFIFLSPSLIFSSVFQWLFNVILSFRNHLPNY